MPLRVLPWLYFALAVILLQIVTVSPDIFRSIIWTLCPMWHISQIIFCLWGFLCVRDAGCRGNKITALGCNSWLHQPFRQPFAYSMCYQVIVSLCNRAREERRWQTLCDKCDNNFVWKKFLPNFTLLQTDLFVKDQKTLMWVKIMTKHPSNSPVTFVTHKRFTVFPLLSVVLSRKLINIFILVVSRTTIIIIIIIIIIKSSLFKSYQNLNSGNLLINGLNSWSALVGSSGPSSSAKYNKIN